MRGLVVTTPAAPRLVADEVAQPHEVWRQPKPLGFDPHRGVVAAHGRAVLPGWRLSIKVWWRP